MTVNHESLLDDLWARVRSNIDTQIDKAKTLAQDTLEWAENLESTAGDHAERAEQAATSAGTAAATEVEKLTAGAPEAFDTLGEIATELAANETERASLTNTLAAKADQEAVDTALAGKADSEYVDNAVEGKADKEYVDNKVGELPSAQLVDVLPTNPDQNTIYFVKEQL